MGCNFDAKALPAAAAETEGFNKKRVSQTKMIKALFCEFAGIGIGNSVSGSGVQI